MNQNGEGLLYKAMEYIESDWIVETGNRNINKTNQFNGNGLEYVSLRYKTKGITISRMVSEYGSQVEAKKAIIDYIKGR